MKPYTQPGSPSAVSDSNYVLVLSANTVESITIPTGAVVARVMASAGPTVMLPDGDPPNIADTTNGSAGQGVPVGVPMDVDVRGMTTLRFNSTGTPTVTVSFYGKQ